MAKATYASTTRLWRKKGAWFFCAVIVCVMAVRVVGVHADIQSDLVGWWRLNNSYDDSSGNGLTLTPSTPAPVSTTNQRNQADSAFAFDGTDNYLTLPNNDLVNTAPSYSAKSVSLWFKVGQLPDATTNMAYLYEEGGSANNYMDVFVTSDGLVHGVVGTDEAGDGANTYRSEYTAPITTGVWHSVLLVYVSNDYPYLYVDGQLANGGDGMKNSTLGVMGYHGSEPSLIGAAMDVSGADNDDGNGSDTYSGTGPHHFFNGSISDVRLYNRALTGGEAAELYDQSAPPAPPMSLARGENKLVGHWKLDGNAKDNTPYADNGTVSGAAATADRFGKVSGAYGFNGVDQYITIPDAPILRQTGDMSVSFWVNVTNNGAYQALISKGVTGEYEVGADFSSGKADLAWRSTNASSTALAGFFSGYTGTSVFVTVTVTGTNASVYRNGVLQGTLNIGTRTATSNPLTLGARSGGAYPAKGTLDDVRVYARALSLSDIRSLYGSYDATLNLRSSSKGLVGSWPFTRNAKDDTPYSHNGTVSGAVMTTDRAGRADAAYAFDGSSYIYATGPSPLPMPYLTVSSWIYQKDSSFTGAIVSRYSASAPVDGDWFLGVTTGSPAEWSFNLYCGGVLHTTQTRWVGTGTWQMLSGTYDGNEIALYLGSVRLSSTPVACGPLPSVSTPLYIGSWSDGSNGWQGTIDNVQLYNRALSESELEARHTHYE